MLLGKSSTVAWYKHKNICYIILFTDLVIWGCNIYILGSKQQKNILDPRTSKYPCVCPPVIYPSLLPPSVYGFFTVYYNSAKFIIYFELNTRRVKIIFHFYIDEYDVELHPEESMTFGNLALQ